MSDSMDYNQRSVDGMSGSETEGNSQENGDAQPESKDSHYQHDDPSGSMSAEGENLNKLILKALLLSKDVGGLIGKGGSTIRAMREETGCKIMISDAIPQVHERVLTVIGPVDMVGRAFCLIAMQLEKESAEQAPGMPHIFINLLVPNQQTGAIIGKGGSRIRDIREECNANISVATDPLPQSNERLVTVMGDSTSVGAAIAVIAGILHKNPSRGTVMPFRPHVRLQQYQLSAVNTVNPQWTPSYGYTTHMPGGYYPAHAVIPPAAHAIKVHPAHIGHNPNGALLDSHVTQIVPIYAEYAGAIIGKSGSRINDIRSLSGTHIKIEDQAPGTSERQIVISGPQHACQAAIQMIQQRIEEEIARREALPQ